MYNGIVDLYDNTNWKNVAESGRCSNHMGQVTIITFQKKINADQKQLWNV